MNKIELSSREKNVILVALDHMWEHLSESGKDFTYGSPGNLTNRERQHAVDSVIYKIEKIPTKLVDL